MSNRPEVVTPAPEPLAEIEAVAVELAESAGRIVVDYYRQAPSVEFKDAERRDPVTAADRASEAFLVGEIGERFPEHSVLGEEGAPGNPSAEYLWVVDPLDGTANFVNRLPIFAVSIGVLHRRRPVVGAIFVVGPEGIAGTYHARLGGGAYLGERRLAVSATPSPSGLASLPAYPSEMFHLGGGFARSAGTPRVLGSAAAEIALVASGVLQFAAFRQLRIWDVAGGVTLVSEAGGVVNHWAGWRRGWAPLEAFEPRLITAADPTGLRAWSEPLLAGGPGAADTVGSKLRPAFRLRSVFRR